MYLTEMHILVIDNDARRRQSTERVLHEEGFAVTGVGEGFSALRAASRGRFALAVAAVQLPGMLDGPTTLRQLRLRQPWMRGLFTGAPALRPTRLDRDRDDFIAAPLRRHEFVGCVFELLQRGGAQARAG